MVLNPRLFLIPNISLANPILFYTKSDTFFSILHPILFSIPIFFIPNPILFLYQNWKVLKQIPIPIPNFTKPCFKQTKQSFFEREKIWYRIRDFFNIKYFLTESDTFFYTESDTCFLYNLFSILNPIPSKEMKKFRNREVWNRNVTLWRQNSFGRYICFFWLAYSSTLCFGW